MTIRLKNTRDILQDGRVKMLVYGDSGVGKTVFAGSFPKPLFLAAEEGLMSLAEMEIPYVEIKDWKETNDVYDFINTADSRKKYDTIVIDSLTDLQQLLIGFILDRAGRETMEIQDWGVALELLRKFMRELRSLPYHIVFICRETRSKDDGTGVVKSAPALSGKMAEDAPAYVDIVMNLVVESKREDGAEVFTRFGKFQPSSRHEAKDRTNRMPGVMKDPTGGKVVSRMAKGTEKPKGSVRAKKGKKERKK